MFYFLLLFVELLSYCRAKYEINRKKIFVKIKSRNRKERRKKYGSMDGREGRVRRITMFLHLICIPSIKF